MSLDLWKPSCIKTLTEDKIYRLGEAVKGNIKSKEAEPEIRFFLLEFRRHLLPFLQGIGSFNLAEWEELIQNASISEIVQSFSDGLSHIDDCKITALHEQIKQETTQKENYYKNLSKKVFVASNNCIVLCSYDLENGLIVSTGNGGPLAELFPDDYKEGGNLKEIGINLGSREFIQAKQKARAINRKNGGLKGAQVKVGGEPLHIIKDNQNFYFELSVAYLDKDPYTREEIFGIYLTDISRRIELMMTDSLTGLFNRREFVKRFDFEVERSKRTDSPLTVVLLDIDHFKNVNDTFGHSSGDEVLTKVAQTLKNKLRAIDTIARHGGEEFAILLTETDLEHAMQVAEKLRQTIENMLIELDNGQKTNVTISLGVHQVEIEAIDPIKHTLNQADKALYYAKSQGRNQVMLSTKENELFLEQFFKDKYLGNELDVCSVETQYTDSQEKQTDKHIK